MRQKQKHDRLILLFILSLALLLRLISLNQSFWLDEAISAKVARFSLTQIFDFLSGDFNPPVYYLFISFWQNLFRVSEISLRMPSVIFALLTIIITFKIGQTWLNSHAKLAALMLATSPLHIYYSQEARAYALTALLFTALVWLFLISLKNKKYWWWFSLICLLSVFSHYQIWLALPVFPLVLFWGSKEKRSPEKKWLYLGLSFLPILITLIFYWPILSSQLSVGNQINSSWKQVIGTLTIKNIGLIAVKFVIGRINLNNQFLYFATGFLLVFFYWGLAILGTIKSLAKQNWQFFLPTIFFLPLFLGIIISLRVPLLSYFRFLFLLPFFYLLITRGILVIKNNRLKKIIFCLIIIINLTCSFVYLTKDRFQRENWRLAVSLLKRTAPDVPVFIHPKINSAFNYYNRQQLTIVAPEDFGYHQKINLISYGLPIFDPEDKIRERLTASGFKIVWGDSFNQVGIEKWQKK